MTATSSPPETLEPSEPARKHEEIDPVHDIDAKQTILWLGISGLVVFISLWVLLQVFKVVVVSEAFEGQPLLRRHQQVNVLLAEELKAGLHALSMETLTPAQWTARGGEILASPPCLGGSKAEG